MRARESNFLPELCAGYASAIIGLARVICAHRAFSLNKIKIEIKINKMEVEIKISNFEGLMIFAHY